MLALFQLYSTVQAIAKRRIWSSSGNRSRIPIQRSRFQHRPALRQTSDTWLEFLSSPRGRLCQRICRYRSLGGYRRAFCLLCDMGCTGGRGRVGAEAQLFYQYPELSELRAQVREGLGLDVSPPGSPAPISPFPHALPATASSTPATRLLLSRRLTAPACKNPWEQGP